MADRFPGTDVFRHNTQLIYDSAELSPDQKWRLVESLFAQDGSIVAGSLALAIALVTVGWWSGDRLFDLLAGGCLIVLAARMVMHRHFRRHGHHTRQTAGPEIWARRHLIGALSFAVFWGIADLVATLRVSDQNIAMFLFMVQSGWLAGAAGRNAVSPAAVTGQSIVVLLPCALGCLFSGQPLLMLGSVFIIVQFIAAFSIAGFAAAHFGAMLRSERELEAANIQLQHLSTTDALTGIPNRRAFESVLTVEWSRASREASPLALLAVDVDHFKSFNDRYGHPAGDACLRLIAGVLSDGLRRPPDYIARTGGEEFMAILPGTDGRTALEVAERLRRAVEESGLSHEGSGFGRVTICIGVHATAPRPGMEPQAHIDLADQALYAAKQAGRNVVRVPASGAPLPPPTQESARAAAAKRAPIRQS